MKKLILIMFCAMLSLAAVAQHNRLVKGYVMNEEGKPLSGATIQVVNSDSSTVTDKDGYFEIKAKTNIAKKDGIGFKSVGEFYFGRNLGLNYVGGYRFNKYLFVGAGIGVNIATEMEDDGRGDDLSIPLFGYVKTNFTKSRWSPFFALPVGMKFLTTPTFRETFSDDSYYDYNFSTPQFFVSPQIGVDCNINEKISTYLSIALSYTWVDYESVHYDEYIEHSYRYDEKYFDMSLEMHFGVNF